MGILGNIRRAFVHDARPERPDFHALSGRSGGRPIRGRYDAASDPVDLADHWALSDPLDADLSNSLSVRKKLRERSRLERANNAYATGIIQTHANMVVGVGPTLRMQTGSAAFNTMVEAKWLSWCRATGFLRKLRVMHVAKTGDGEAFARLKSNPRVDDPVKLDLHLIECDQVSSPWLPYGTKNRVDGVWFDEFGNPTHYDVLRYHPGAAWSYSATLLDDAEKVPAEFMLHWFRADRPGQHRGVPEITSSLTSFAEGRRWRESVIAAAETAANLSAVLKMPEHQERGPDVAQPFSTMPIEKRMFIATPAGADIFQFKAEQPNAEYATLHRALLSECGRPLGMSYVIAALDSNGTSFSGGKLDQLNYQVVVVVDREDCEQMVLDRVFAQWFREAVVIYGWAVDGRPSPKHGWAWPGMPQIDNQKTANARKIALSCGATSLGRIYSEDGLDFDDELPAMAEQYGVSVSQLKSKLFDAVFAAASTTDKNETEGEDPEGEPPQPASAGKEKSTANGFSRRFSLTS
jgi:lambda family phage portal protein